jgi:hypothetical protein
MPTPTIIRTETRRSTLFLLAILLLSGAKLSHAQPVGERVGPQFPFMKSSARVAGLADADGATIDDFSGFGSNPGVLGLMKFSVVDYSSQRVKRGITFEHIGIAYKATDLDAIAFAVDVLHFGGTDFYTDSRIRQLGYELRTGLAYGRLFGDQFSAGLNLQAITATTGITATWAFLGDLGLAYAPGKYIRYGFFIKGISTDYKVQTQILQTDVFTPRISRYFGISVNLDFPFADQTEKILVALQNEKLIGEKTIIYKLGVEYYPFWSRKGFRAGMRGGFIVREPDLQPRFGLSFGFGQFSVDYAYRYTRRIVQPSHLFTLSFIWGEKEPGGDRETLLPSYP